MDGWTGGWMDDKGMDEWVDGCYKEMADAVLLVQM